MRATSIIPLLLSTLFIVPVHDIRCLSRSNFQRTVHLPHGRPLANVWPTSPVPRFLSAVSDNIYMNISMTLSAKAQPGDCTDSVAFDDRDRPVPDLVSFYVERINV
jgi:hypothetical protein